MTRSIALLKDRPGAASFLAVVLVTAHVVASRKVKVLDFADLMAGASQLVDVYVGFAGVAAMVAGFVGLLVVFATTTGVEWSTVRDLAGDSLRRNWLSPVRTTLAAAFLSTFAAIAEQISHGRVAWWTFELAVLLVASAGVRVLWLLGGLLLVQQNVDRAAAAETKRPTLADLGMEEKSS